MVGTGPSLTPARQCRRLSAPEPLRFLLTGTIARGTSSKCTIHCRSTAMTTYRRPLLSFALAALCVLIPPASPMAHPPFAPYDNTRFAPITQFGPSIGIEVAASGLTAPLKGVTAPG